MTASAGKSLHGAKTQAWHVHETNRLEEGVDEVRWLKEGVLQFLAIRKSNHLATHPAHYPSPNLRLLSASQHKFAIRNDAKKRQNHHSSSLCFCSENKVLCPVNTITSRFKKRKIFQFSHKARRKFALCVNCFCCAKFLREQLPSFSTQDNIHYLINAKVSGSVCTDFLE